MITYQMFVVLQNKFNQNTVFQNNDKRAHDLRKNKRVLIIKDAETESEQETSEEGIFTIQKNFSVNSVKKSKMEFPTLQKYFNAPWNKNFQK